MFVSRNFYLFSLVAALSVSSLQATSDRVLQNVEKVFQIDQEIGLSRDQLIQAFETIDIAQQKKGKVGKTKGYTIKRCPVLKGYLIQGPQAKVGSGAHKKVNKAVFYGSDVKVIADCESDDSALEEIKILKKLAGKKGIVPYLGSTIKGKKKHIYLEYFPEKSLRKKLNDEEFSFTEEQILHIARNLIEGLRSMHKVKLVHRDLHAGNFLLKNSNGNLFEAVLVDFGKTLLVKNSRLALPQVPKTKNPPELLVQSLSKIDRYSTDIYALGCIFYHIIWREPLPWSTAYIPKKAIAASLSKRKKLYGKIVASYAQTREKEIGSLLVKKQNEGALTEFEQFQICVFDMIHYNPKMRPLLEQLIKQLSSVC